MKVIMLDIDGVLNCKSSNWKRKWPLDWFKAILVNHIRIQTGAKIVLSSSWRSSPEGVKRIKKKIGVKIYDKTPNLTETYNRGNEIQAWLDQHPEVTKYAILDDDKDFLPEQMNSFFQTTFEEGLTEELAAKIIKYLNS